LVLDVMTIQQTILAVVPFVVLVALIIVMLRVVKNHPERLETLRTWGIVEGGVAVIIQIYFIAKHH
jgi:hypothetical protein